MVDDKRAFTLMLLQDCVTQLFLLTKRFLLHGSSENQNAGTSTGGTGGGGGYGQSGKYGTGGGGGSHDTTGYNGGPGLVVLRYPV